MKYLTFSLRAIVAFVFFLFSFSSQAQLQPGRYFNASLGIGYSFPNSDIDVSGSGFYAQGEYVYNLTKWFGLRPYAGVILTSPDDNKDQQFPGDFQVSTKAFVLGGKARVAAPIPWVAPYFEVGIGASMGSFKTITPEFNIKKSGVLLHVPFSIGLALGRKHNFDVGFTYYIHDAAEQFNGAFAIGYSIPLE
ncbi:outer membrane beta-barrel protein [Flavobacterium sp. RSSB_23]|uniref:outer membrane beta-barrel protein n=1 Tax=Flavobacterium sp. RSSB_23 TaxID=3447668 RepID=UPI003F349337